MNNLEKFRQLTVSFSEVADFVTVYISEGHPTDGWAVSGNVKVAKHKSLDERVSAAKKMLELQAVGSAVLIDPLNDESRKAYNATLERLYIIMDGVIVYKGAQGPYGYKMSEVEAWLKKYRGE